MKKKILIILMLFISVFAFSACGSKKENKEKENSKKEIATPLMYEVTKEGSNNKIYILGTIHIGDLSNVEFSDYVLNAFDKSEYVAAEVDNEDPSEDGSMLDEINSILYPDDDNLKNHLTEEQYNKLMKFIDDNKLDEGYFNKDKLNLKYYLQVLMQYVIEESGLNTDDGIDNYFVNKAKKEGKKFLEVESSEFQNEVLLSLSDSFYAKSLMETIDNIDEEIENAKNDFKNWKEGNEEELWKDDGSLIKEEDYSKYSEEDIKAAKDFDEKILYSRNLSMTDKFEEFFNNGYNMFFMVGQDHVIGDKGIVSYLRQRGYTVNKISK